MRRISTTKIEKRELGAKVFHGPYLCRTAWSGTLQTYDHRMFQTWSFSFPGTVDDRYPWNFVLRTFAQIKFSRTFPYKSIQSNSFLRTFFFFVFTVPVRFVFKYVLCLNTFCIRRIFHSAGAAEQRSEPFTSNEFDQVMFFFRLIIIIIQNAPNGWSVDSVDRIRKYIMIFLLYVGHKYA